MTSEFAPPNFNVLSLVSTDVSLRCAPELGGRVFSLINRRSGREWLWRQSGARELFRPTEPADFGTGCFAGLDECVPSVGACIWSDGRKVADHGAVWARAWTIEAQAVDGFTLSVEAPELGLRLTRSIRLRGATVRFEYTLANGSALSAPAMWCMHPLFTWERGDRLELPPAITSLRVQGVRPDLPAEMTGSESADDLRPTIAFPEMLPGVRLGELALADNEDGYLKAFTAAYAKDTGAAALWNVSTADRLEVSWDAQAAPYLGIWLTRGGFRGWDHIALEPTTAPHDRVDLAARNPLLTRAVTLAPGEQRNWWVEWRMT